MKPIPKKFQKIISDVVKQYKSKSSTISVLLFGSFARGTFHKNSDIDIEVIYSGKKYKTLEENKQGIKIDIEIWPKEKLVNDFKKNPFLKYPYLSEKILYDPTGFAKKFKKRIKTYFDKNPFIKQLWVEWEREYNLSKKRGKKIKEVDVFYKELKKKLK